MRNPPWLLCLIALSFSGLGSSQQVGQAKVPTESNATNGSPTQAQNPTFDYVRKLLSNYRVPFDPDALRKKTWRTDLEPTFEQMPEMKRVLYVNTPLHGVYFADTLYLPEQVEVSGDMVVVVRNLVFEGKRPVVKGNHRVSFFPLSPTAVLGSSLQNALEKADWKDDKQLPAFSAIRSKLDIQPSTGLTIDVSAPSPPKKEMH